MCYEEMVSCGISKAVCDSWPCEDLLLLDLPGPGWVVGVLQILGAIALLRGEWGIDRE